jgi:membrane associated rhomboid family serine protease
LGYLVARAVFSRRLKWILVAVMLLVFFGTLLSSLLPTVDSRVSWQSHVCGAAVGVAVAWFLHPRRGSRARPARRAPVR